MMPIKRNKTKMIANRLRRVVGKMYAISSQTFDSVFDREKKTKKTTVMKYAFESFQRNFSEQVFFVFAEEVG